MYDDPYSLRSRIIQRLKDLGYEADINFVLSEDRTQWDLSLEQEWDFDEHPLVRKNQKLTPKGESSRQRRRTPLTLVVVWSNIQQTLVDFVLTSRPARIAAERKAAMKARGMLLKDVLIKYRASLPPGTNIPPNGDIANSAPFRAIWDIDTGIEVHASYFDAALASIPELWESWHQAVDDALLKCLDLSDPAELMRAVTRVFCQACTAGLFYHQVHEHKCFTRHLYSGPYTQEQANLLLQFWIGLQSVPWNQENVLRKPAYSHELTFGTCTEMLASLCGLDPSTATAEDMDAAGSTFVCKTCVEEKERDYYYLKEGRAPMTWLAVVSEIVLCKGMSNAVPDSTSLYSPPRSVFLCTRCTGRGGSN